MKSAVTGVTRLFLSVLGPTVLLASQTPQLSAQIVKSPPPPGSTTHTIVPGTRYQAGGFKRWLLGTDYRDLWSVPLEVPVLNLDSVGGGLTPVRTGGFGQSISLHFDGEDGRRYVVRSVDKDPTKRLVEYLKDTFVEDIIQDQISALHPTGALVVDPILEATGIPHATHGLVIIPDDARLGEFRNEFAGMLGTLVLHPDEGADDTPGFAGSRRISGTEEFLESLEDSPCDRVDARLFLKARLVDILIGDKDRHAGQWRWATYPDGECRVWQPIPEDRDQAFVDFDGFVMWLARRARPQQIKFGPKYPDMTGLTFNGWEMDRELLAGLDKPVWDSLVAVVQHEVTDSVIDAAVRRLPPPHYVLSGEFLANSLKRRRDALHQPSDWYYRLLAHWPDVKGTDRDEWARLTYRDGGRLEVQLGLLTGTGGEQEPPYFTRTFGSDVTKDVRIYMKGGDDRIEILGTYGEITLRVDGGGGDDEFVNSSEAGASRVRFYDARGDNRFVTGAGAKIDRREWQRPPAKDQAHVYGLDWGGRSLTYPLFSYSPDPGVFVALSRSWERYGYRKDPFASRHSLLVGLVSNGPEPIISYRGTFRQIAPRVDGKLRLEYTGLDFLKFYGYGNETEASLASAFYEIEQRDALVLPTLAIQLGSNRGGRAGAGTEPLRQTVSLEFGPIFKYHDTPSEGNSDKFFGSIEPPYGSGKFRQLGALAALDVDTRDNSGHARNGIHIAAIGTVYPALFDVRSLFGTIEGTASTYLTAKIPTEPTLALRVGGKKVWGDYPFLDAAYLGGGGTLRGTRSRRYAGNASVYGNAELRLTVAPFKILVPGSIGVFGLADVGRVFYADDPTDADSWHEGIGGGIWLSFINRMQTLTVAVASGEDMTGLYIRAGFMY